MTFNKFFRCVADLKKLLNFYFKDTISISFFQDFLDVANLGAEFFDRIIQTVFGRLNNHVVRVEILEFSNAETAFKLADTIEAMLRFIKTRDAPEIVALDAPLARVAHRLHM